LDAPLASAPFPELPGSEGEQGRGRRHVPELRPPNHRVCNHRCTGSIRARESSPGPQVLQRHGHLGIS
jgi:hypothetical protein